MAALKENVEVMAGKKKIRTVLVIVLLGYPSFMIGQIAGRAGVVMYQDIQRAEADRRTAAYSCTILAGMQRAAIELGDPERIRETTLALRGTCWERVDGDIPYGSQTKDTVLK